MKKYLGQGIAQQLGQATGLDAEDTEVVAYGLEYLLSAVLGFFIILIAAFLLGFLPETAAVLVCWILVRRCAGGAHCSAIWRCTVGSCLSALAAVLITRGATSVVPVTLWTGITAVWTLWATWKWAPNNSKKPVRDPAKRSILRRRALFAELFLGLVLLFLSLNNSEPLREIAAAGGGGLASAALMISPTGSLLVSKFDNICQVFVSIFFKRR